MMNNVALVIIALGWLLFPLDLWVQRRHINRLEARIDLFSAVLNEAADLISLETQKKLAQKKAYERLTDPEAIVEDMERGARIREMKDANRRTLPREDAGPPARRLAR